MAKSLKSYLVFERKLVKLIKNPVIASDEGAKQSLNLSELTLEIASAKNASQ